MTADSNSQRRCDSRKITICVQASDDLAARRDATQVDAWHPRIGWPATKAGSPCWHRRFSSRHAASKNYYSSMRPQRNAAENSPFCNPCHTSSSGVKCESWAGNYKNNRFDDHDNHQASPNYLIVKEHFQCERSPGFQSSPRCSPATGKKNQTITGSLATALKSLPRLVTLGSTESAGPRSNNST